MNSSTKIDVSNYTFDELNKCTRPFTEYKQDNGDTQPVNTGYSLFDKSGNWLAFYLGYKTNQTYVVRILDILNNIEKEYKENRAFGKPFVVYDTLTKLKKIYDEMMTAGIKNGKTIDGLVVLFGHFHFPYDKTGEQYDTLSQSIFHQVKDLDLGEDNNSLLTIKSGL